MPAKLDKHGYIWCPDCDAYRHTKIWRWETSKAVIVDEECVRCGRIFDRETKSLQEKE